MLNCLFFLLHLQCLPSCLLLIQLLPLVKEKAHDAFPSLYICLHYRSLLPSLCLGFLIFPSLFAQIRLLHLSEIVLQGIYRAPPSPFVDTSPLPLQWPPWPHRCHCHPFLRLGLLWPSVTPAPVGLPVRVYSQAQAHPLTSCLRLLRLSGLRAHQRAGGKCSCSGSTPGDVVLWVWTGA